MTLSFIPLLLPLIFFSLFEFRKWNSNTRTSTKCWGRFKCNYCLGRYCSSLCSADRQDAGKAFFKSHCNFYTAIISRDFNFWMYRNIKEKTCEIARIEKFQMRLKKSFALLEKELWRICNTSLKREYLLRATRLYRRKDGGYHKSLKYQRYV